MELTDRQLPFELKIYMDEAGRGPLAGPVSVGTVIQTSSDLDKSQFADSKKLSPKKRETIYEKMCVDSCRDALLARLQSGSSLPRPHSDNVSCSSLGLPSLLFSVGFASAHEIDEYGIIGSLQMASIRSLYQTIVSFYDNILKLKLEESVRGEDHIFRIVMENELSNLEQDFRRFGKISEDVTTKGIFGHHSSSSDILPEKPDLSLKEQLQFLRFFFHTSQRQFAYKGLYIDGNHTFGLDKLLDLKVQTIIKGDARNPMIGAASIAAKVERDRYMKQIDSDYPGWGFAKHKGYGTKEHREEIAKRLNIEKAKMREDGNVKKLKDEKAKTKGSKSHDTSSDQLIPRSNRSGGQVVLTPEHRITFLSRICSGESNK